MYQGTYYIGIDQGTSSVGWAVTDVNYCILRAKGKDLWGVREFAEADSAAARRMQRTARRRTDREQTRIGLLKEYFSDAIEAVDPLFFIRMENSKYYPEDKDLRLDSVYGLFDDEKYTDKEFYKDYPTVFHLRRELIRNDKAPYDVRLVYLAISNMFKHRGHFLLSAEGGEANADDIEMIYTNIASILEEEYGLEIPAGASNNIITILSDTNTGKRRKQEQIAELFKAQKSEKQKIEFIKCLCGCKADASVMFACELEEKTIIEFSNFAYLDSVDSIIHNIGEDRYEVIGLMKQIYDFAALSRILNGYDYLSEARVASYEKHGKDLDLLHEVYKMYCSKEVYCRMFRSAEDGTYGAYVNSLNSDDSCARDDENKRIRKYRRNMNKPGRTAEALYATIKKDLAEHADDENVKYIMSEIDKETFLPKQLTGANGIIPNQVHAKELNKILKNAEQYLPFLLEKDESGLTVSERVSRLFSFQIPYYVGPVNPNSKTGWAVRKADGRVLPWNIFEKIDKAATSEKFIQNLIRKCTYLQNEKVLPKASLLYEKFCVLNEINNIQVNGERLDTSVKQGLFTEVFGKGKKVTRKQICTYLHVGDEELSGVDNSINSSLASYGKMYAVFGDSLSEDAVNEAAEEIIRLGTIYADSKSMFKEKLAEYADKGIIEYADISRISGYKFKDWGRFSKELLCLKGCDNRTGEVLSLIDAMWEYSMNFMELINSDDFTFKQALEDKSNASIRTLSDFTADDLDELYFSAPVKRMIWQSVLVIKEIVEIMGHEPDRIFIEMARSDEEKGDKGRKDSRAKQLLECYKNIKNTEVHNWKDEITAADSEGKLRSKKLYLYYMQQGKDMYTGKDIELAELFDDSKYDIDHIYPRSLVKDDSLINNLVLVNKKANEDIKKNIYPIPSQIASVPEVRQLWDALYQTRLISDEKYRRLIDRTPFSERKLAGFIERQLVETRQGTKGIADIFKALMPEVTIIYSKAGNVSDFRKDNGFLKSRVLNEFHHAQDAYLNIVVGNVYHTKFTSNPMNFIRKEYTVDSKKNAYNLARMFDRNVTRNGYCAWKATSDTTLGTIETVRKMMNKNSPLVTFLSYVDKGQLFNLTLYGKYKAKAGNYVPIKSSGRVKMDVEKYGGYTSLNPAYFIFISYRSGKKRKKSFDTVSMYAAAKITNTDTLKKYCEEELGYEDVEIICPMIKKGSLIRLDGYYLYIAGLDSRKNVEFHNATNMHASRSYANYIHCIEVSQDSAFLHRDISEEKNIKLYDYLTEKHNAEPFSRAPKPLGEILRKGRELFAALSVTEQAKTLYKLIQLSSLQNANVSLKEIGGPSENGRIRISGNMTDRKELVIINTSVTGIIVGESTNLLK